MAKGKTPYLDMIVEAIFNLQEKKGSTPKKIWAYMSTHFKGQVTNYAVFKVQLRRALAGGKHVERNGPARVKLNTGFRAKVIKHMAKSGKKSMPVMAQVHAMTTKSKNARKAKKLLRKKAAMQKKKARKAL